MITIGEQLDFLGLYLDVDEETGEIQENISDDCRKNEKCKKNSNNKSKNRDKSLTQKSRKNGKKVAK